MPWPWRRARGRHAASTPAAVAAPTMPAPAPADDEVLPPSMSVPVQPVSAATQDTTVGVRLGFHDGSEVHLSSGDPRARALREVADVLLHGDRT